jgi:RNA polymerase sigma-70 factor (ECF subfamily)
LVDPEAPEARESVPEDYRGSLLSCADRVLRDRDEAEDVVQEVLLRCSDPERLRDAKSLGGWLHAVCYRLAIDRVRARKRREQALRGIPSRPAPPGAAAAAEEFEERSKLRAEIDRLAEPYRTALRLRYLEGLEYPEVAARMGSIERTARTWVGRGITRLRERMGARRT